MCTKYISILMDNWMNYVKLMKMCFQKKNLNIRFYQRLKELIQVRIKFKWQNQKTNVVITVEEANMRLFKKLANVPSPKEWHFSTAKKYCNGNLDLHSVNSCRRWWHSEFRHAFGKRSWLILRLIRIHHIIDYSFGIFKKKKHFIKKKKIWLNYTAFQTKSDEALSFEHINSVFFLLSTLLFPSGTGH